MNTDPAAKQDLSGMPAEDLRDWLRIERKVKTDFLVSPRDERVERARWASGRIKKIEGELRSRSGRQSKG